MIVPRDRQSQRWKICEPRGHVVIGWSFHNAPAIILSPGGGSMLKINFLETILSNVADVKIAGQPIEGKPPWISQSVGPNFRCIVRDTHERVVGRDGIRRNAAF